MNQLKEYTPEQIHDAEKLCQLIQDIPETRRNVGIVFIKAYIDGFEAGAAYTNNLLRQAPGRAGEVK